MRNDADDYAGLPAQTEIKILPKDKPSAGACSRCGGSLDGNRQVAVEWNGVRFAYCVACQVKVEAGHAAENH